MPAVCGRGSVNADDKNIRSTGQSDTKRRTSSDRCDLASLAHIIICSVPLSLSRSPDKSIYSSINFLGRRRRRVGVCVWGSRYRQRNDSLKVVVELLTKEIGWRCMWPQMTDISAIRLSRIRRGFMSFWPHVPVQTTYWTHSIFSSFAHRRCITMECGLISCYRPRHPFIIDVKPSFTLQLRCITCRVWGCLSTSATYMNVSLAIAELPTTLGRYQCVYSEKNCVIHTWALQMWASYDGALYSSL